MENLPNNETDMNAKVSKNNAENDKIKDDTLPEDRHKKVYPLVDEIEADLEFEDNVIIPSNSRANIAPLLNFVYRTDKIEKYFTREQLLTTNINVNMAEKTNYADILHKTVNEIEPVNEIFFGEKKEHIRTLKVKGTKLKGKAAIAAIKDRKGLGSNVLVPLWHTGIYVTLTPPKNKRILNLEMAIAKNTIDLGRKTNTLIYSNYSAVYMRIVTEFIAEHIVSTSLSVPDDKDLFDIIKINDLPLLITGILSAMYPKGYDVTRTCKNTLEFLDNENKPKCDYSVTGKIMPEKMLWVDRKMLTKKALEHMSNQRPESMSYDEVIEYQSTMTKYTKEIEIDDGMFVGLELPSINEVIADGSEWVDKIINDVESLFTDATSEEAKNIRVSEMASSMMLSIYGAWYTKIYTTDDTIYETKKSDVISIMEELSDDETILDKTLTSIKEFIEESSFAIVATPNYICPKCKEEQNDNNDGAFSELLPLNVVEHFLDLCASKVQQIRQRDIF